MSRWTTITSDHLKAAGHGTIIDQASALETGEIDPVEEAIADATARVRRAVSTGNLLDVDAGKVPNSLKGVAIRIALFALMERIGLPLSDDQRDTRRDDMSDLKRISDNRTHVEAPDTPGDGEIASVGGTVAAVNVPARVTGREKTSGL